MTDKAVSDLWWKNAIIYGLDVKTFLDADGDGIGDLAGLTRRLDYLRDLGVTCLWLLPFYPSPLRDDGYDISDFYAVDRRLGSFGDFVELVRTAHSLGIRVLVDLVLNHTSDTHAWFLEARRDRDSRYRDYYVWADRPPPDPAPVVYPGEQQSTWTYDEQAGQWYFHRYFDFQPDLNITNPEVRDEINKILGFWLELGVDAFRIDSLPFLIQKDGIQERGEQRHSYLRNLRSFLTRRRGDAVFLGEANVPPDAQRTYFGDPRCPHDASQAHMQFDFNLQAGLWLAFARGDAGPVRRALGRRPDIPEDCQYAVFVRHHDELTLEFALSPAETREVFAAFDPDGRGRIYDRGLRRRLAPLLSGDRPRIRLALSLLFSLPGTPLLLYGDEIGLGDDLSLPGRSAVRVPMQWSDRPAGASPPPVRTGCSGDPCIPGRTAGPRSTSPRNTATRTPSWGSSSGSSACDGSVRRSATVAGRCRTPATRRCSRCGTSGRAAAWWSCTTSPTGRSRCACGRRTWVRSRPGPYWRTASRAASGRPGA